MDIVHGAMVWGKIRAKPSLPHSLSLPLPPGDKERKAGWDPSLIWRSDGAQLWREAEAEWYAEAVQREGPRDSSCIHRDDRGPADLC